MNYLIYLFYPVLGLVLLKGAKLCRAGEWNEALNYRQMKAIRGFCAICIMFHHMGQKTCAAWLKEEYIVHGLDFFVPIGYLLVAVFFFSTGYGLYKSWKEKENYLEGFIWRRVVPVIIVSCLISLLYLAVRIKMGEPLLDNWSNIGLFRLGEPPMLNVYGWFIYALLVIYFAFWLSFRKIKKEWVSFFVFALIIFGYIGFCIFWMYGGWWYNTILVTLLGMLVAKQEGKIIPWIKRKYPVCLTLSLGGFVAFFFYARSMEEQLYAAWIQMPVSVLFILCIVLISLKVKINNKVLTLAGGLSLELYLVHGLFVQLFGYCFVDENLEPLIYIKNPALYAVVVILLSVLSACFIKWACSWVYRFLSWKKELTIDVVRWFFTLLFGVFGVVTVIAIYLSVSGAKLSKEREHLIEEYAKEHITFVQTDGKQMSAYMTGEGEHTIVLLGTSQDACPSLSLKPLADFLSETCRVIVLDRFGQGFSEDTSSIRNAENIVDEIHEALQNLGVEGKYVLMPHGSAGIYVQQYIQAYPEEVKAVIGLDSWLPDQYKESLRISGLSEESYILRQERAAFLTYYGVKIGEKTSGLSRMLWHAMEGYHPILREDDRIVLGEITTKKYANKNSLEEELYFYSDSRELFGQTYSGEIPVLFMLSYVSAERTYRDIQWEDLHKAVLVNSEIQSVKIMDGTMWFPYYKCSKIKEEVLVFLEQTE